MRPHWTPHLDERTEEERMTIIHRNAGLDLWLTILLLLFTIGVDAMTIVKETTTSTRRQQQQQQQPQRFMGIDLGTSGARISLIETTTTTEQNNYNTKEIYNHAILWDNSSSSSSSYDDPNAWIQAVEDLLRGAASALQESESVSLPKTAVQAVCISGTSASCVLIDTTANNTAQSRRRRTRMYNYNVQNEPALQFLNHWVPIRHTARSSTSCLAKLLEWHVESPIQDTERLCHQADFVMHHFLEDHDNDDDTVVYSDWHNCLKLGYDVQNLQWPEWMEDMFHSLGIHRHVLPTVVVSPGQPIPKKRIRPEFIRQFDRLFSESTVFVGGTTDSNAAFIAATGGGGNILPGTAVTSLGSTLAIKQLSHRYVEDAEKGVYSHRFPSTFYQQQSRNDSSPVLWLVGGASNVGCAVLRALHFSNEELADLSQTIDPDTDSPFSYYPLTTKGERFPVSDPNKEPVLEPVPENRVDFLHGILQGISDVERDGFLALGELGAVPSTPVRVWTCGGGSRNDQWTRMRQRRLRKALANDSICVTKATNVEASYGAAILASSSFLLK